MQKSKQGGISRRQLIHGAAILGATATTVGTNEWAHAAQRPKGGTTPPLSFEEKAAIDAALGKKGNYVDAQATYTVPLPRADLKVRVKGEAVPTPLGFGGWVSVKKTRDGKSAVLMSDTVLLQEEVNPLIDAAHASGLEISAIHNHFFYEEPHIFYMHVHGMGSVAEVVKRYAKAISATKLFPANQPPPSPPPAKTGKDLFDVPALDAIVKYSGVVNGPTYKYTIGRSDLTVMAMGAELTSAIGLNTWLSLAGTAENAHAAGDFAMLESEVNPVIMALRKGGMEVVAVHNHMIGESPRIMFLHYYGRGPALQMATAFRAALDVLGSASPNMSHGS